MLGTIAKVRPRKHLEEPGSVVILIVKRAREPRSEWAVVGEFIVASVGYVSREEYEELRKSGRVCEPPVPDFSSGGKIPTTVFKDLTIYPREVKLSELCDVKTARATHPLCEWVITGATVVDEQLVEGIRRKVYGEVKVKDVLMKKIKELETRVARIEGLLGLSISAELPLTHECIERMLLELGKALGFKTYVSTQDQSKKCNDVELKELADLTQGELPLAEELKNIDVIWRGHNTYYLFEVVLTTDMRTSLVRFTEAAELNARYYIVSNNKELFERTISKNIFNQIRRKTHFINLNELLRNYYITKLWRTNIEVFKLPYLST